MAELDDAAIAAYWQARGADLARTIDELERVEDWHVDDGPRLRDAIVELGRVLAITPEGRLRDIADDEMTIDSARIALAYVRAGRRFRLLAALAEDRQDGDALAARVLAPDAEDADAAEAARVLRQSVRHLARLNLLQRVFSPQRLALIREAIMRAGG